MILHLSTQQTGGAAIAALRIHEAQLSVGTESRFLSVLGSGDSEQGLAVVDKIYERFWQRGLERIGFPTTEESRWRRAKESLRLPVGVSGIRSDHRLSRHPLVQRARILHLHWITGMFDWQDFFARTDQPIVWTLHDMNPFLGLFHYRVDSQDANPATLQLDQEIQALKTEILQQRGNITCVGPSDWLREIASSSRALGGSKFCTIRNPVDISVFKPHSARFCREAFGLPQDRKYLLVVAEKLTDPRKGMDLLVEAFRNIDLTADWALVAAGNGKLDIANREVFHVGSIKDPRLVALLYSAVDMVAIPSREDNLPNVVLESLCCGTPVVGMPAGGVAEPIESPRDGIIATEVSALALGRALEEGAHRDYDRNRIATHAAQRFDPKLIATQYQQLYDEILANRSGQ